MPAFGQVMVRVRRLALVALAAWSLSGAAQAGPSFVEGMTRIGFVSGRPMTLDAVQQYMADETKRWSEVITSRNIKIDP